MRGVASLQGVDEGPDLAVHLPRGRGDVFQVTALVEGAVAPVPGLFVVEHGEDSFDCHHAAVVRGTPSDVILKIRKAEVPQDAVEAFHGVFARLCVPCVTHSGIVIDEEAVVTLAGLGVAVVVCQEPYQTIPCAHDYVLDELIDTEAVVSVDVISQYVVFVEILADLVLELLTDIGGEVGGFGSGGDTGPQPSEKPLQGILLLRVQTRPLDVAVTLRLAVSVDAVVDLHAGIEIGGKLRVACGLEQADG